MIGAARYWSLRYWARRYWPKVGGAPPPAPVVVADGVLGVWGRSLTSGTIVTDTDAGTIALVQAAGTITGAEVGGEILVARYNGILR